MRDLDLTESKQKDKHVESNICEAEMNLNEDHQIKKEMKRWWRILMNFDSMLQYVDCNTHVSGSTHLLNDISNKYAGIWTINSIWERGNIF